MKRVGSRSNGNKLKYFSVINNTVKSYKNVVLLIVMHIINLTAFLKNLLLLIASTYTP